MKRMSSSVRFALAALLVVFALPPVFGADSAQEGMSAPPPPTKEQVLLQSMAGKWMAAITVDMPDGTKKTGTGTCELQSIAGGRGVVGTADFDLGDLGKVSYGVMFGFDRWTNLVHFYSVGSSGEVHDHFGSMLGENSFASRWEGIRDGVQTVEDIRTTVEANKIMFHEEDTAEGKPAGTFDFVFTRHGMK